MTEIHITEGKKRSDKNNLRERERERERGGDKDVK